MIQPIFEIFSTRAVLQYRADLQGKGLARDLARVLKISKIG